MYISVLLPVTTCLHFPLHKVNHPKLLRLCEKPPPDRKNLIEGWTVAFYTQFTPFFLIFELCRDRVSSERKARGQRRGKKQGSLKAGRDWKARPVLTAKCANFLLGAGFVFPEHWAIGRYRRGLVPVQCGDVKRPDQNRVKLYLYLLYCWQANLTSC